MSEQIVSICPVMEAVAASMFGIEGVPVKYQKRMVTRAAKEAHKIYSELEKQNAALKSQVKELEAALKRRYEMHDFQNETILKNDTHRIELQKESTALKSQVKELAEAADKMLELLVDNKPIDGIWSVDIDDWDQLIKEGKLL